MPADQSEKAYDEVVKAMSKAFGQSATGAGFAFDGSDFKELNKNLQKRKKILDALKKKMKSGTTKASDWCPGKTKVDHMSRIDRDIQLRQRGRISTFFLRSLHGTVGTFALSAEKSALDKIQK